MSAHSERDAASSIVGLEFFPRQWQAVTAPVGPVLVLAGPGSGKTRCLTGRIASLIEHNGADPSRICAITFTNKAAQEIANRVRRGLGAVAENLTLGTIHSLCLKVLRPFAKQMNLAPGFGVADEDHQLLILRRLTAPAPDKILTILRKDVAELAEAMSFPIVREISKRSDSHSGLTIELRSRRSLLNAIQESGDPPTSAGRLQLSTHGPAQSAVTPPIRLPHRRCRPLRLRQGRK